MSTTVRVVAGRSSGKPVHEEVHVEQDGHARYRLLQSPGLTLGLAAGDVFTLHEDGTFEVLQRGGNVCVQIYFEGDLDEAEQLASREFKKITGYRDGRAANVLVYTVPVKSGFPAIEKVTALLKKRFPQLEWYYGNVYDPRDEVTPLNWWLSS
jgi:hypothetical protein